MPISFFKDAFFCHVFSMRFNENIEFGRGGRVHGNEYVTISWVPVSFHHAEDNQVVQIEGTASKREYILKHGVNLLNNSGGFEARCSYLYQCPGLIQSNKTRPGHGHRCHGMM